jgi:hypothetical protein
MTYHAIERTSPKGPGQKFIGTCMRCGRTGLTSANMNEECENITGMTDDEALLKAIDGPEEAERVLVERKIW